MTEITVTGSGRRRLRESPRGDLVIAACRSGAELAAGVLAEYEEAHQERAETERLVYLENLDTQYSDTETVVRLETDVSGNDVYLFQALYDPTSERSIDENYMAFFIAARAFREWGANHVTAILPYLAYARQDKPAPFHHEPTTAKLAADFAMAAGIDRLVTWHPHVQQIHGFYGGTPVHTLDSLGFFIKEFTRFAGRKDVVAIAPDVGASKFITYLGRALDLSCAIGSKYRPRPEEAVLSEVIGDLSDKRVALIVDDMIGSGGTMFALVQHLYEQEGIEEIYLGASHNLCLPTAHERLEEMHERYGLQQVVTTNTIPQTEAFRALEFIQVRDLTPTLAEVVSRIHYNRPVTELYYRGE